MTEAQIVNVTDFKINNLQISMNTCTFQHTIYNIITIESINFLDIKSISFAVITPDVLISSKLSKYY